jgi:hypothetical protein
MLARGVSGRKDAGCATSRVSGIVLSSQGNMGSGRRRPRAPAIKLDGRV